MQHQLNVNTQGSNLRICAVSHPNNPKTTTLKGFNRPTSISDLPAELLSPIFELGSEGANENKDEAGSPMHPRYWDRLHFHPLERRGDSRMLQGYVQVKALRKPETSVRRLPPSFRLTACLVCRHWYRVATSTPSLWTTLHLGAWDSYKCLKAMFARSGSLPVHVDIWWYMEIDPDEDHPDFDFRDSGEPLPCLGTNYISLFGDLAPRIRSMVMTYSRLSWSKPWVSSLSNLTTLELCEPDGTIRPSWSQFISFLRSTPALKKLSLCLAGPEIDLEDAVAGDPVSLLNLTDLTLRYEWPECAEGLLRVLYMPLLKTLSLEVTESHNLAFIERLAGPATLPVMHPTTGPQYSLLNRLEHLHIAALGLPVSDLAILETLYNGLHNLRTLQFHNSGSSTTTNFFEHLQKLFPTYLVIPGQDTIHVTVRLPRLETLIIHGLDVAYGFIRQVIEKRRDAGFPLKNLYVHKNDYSDLKWLERMWRHSLSFVVVTSDVLFGVLTFLDTF